MICSKGSSSYIEASKVLFESRLRKHYGPARDCWPWSFYRLERRLGCCLPAAYREFLRWFGAHQRGPFYGSEWKPSELASNAASLAELLAEHKIKFDLPTKLVVFLLHGGGKAFWFSLPSTSDDPVVWKYYEGRISQPEQQGTFSQWLLAHLQET